MTTTIDLLTLSKNSADFDLLNGVVIRVDFEIEKEPVVEDGWSYESDCHTTKVVDHIYSAELVAINSVDESTGALAPFIASDEHKEEMTSIIARRVREEEMEC